MKKVLVGTLFILLSVVFANPPVDSFAKEDYSNQWAFTVDEIAIWCLAGKQLYVVNYDDDQWYALNGPGKARAQENNSHEDISPIWADNKKTGTKKSLSFWINKGLELCR